MRDNLVLANYWWFAVACEASYSSNSAIPASNSWLSSRQSNPGGGSDFPHLLSTENVFPFIFTVIYWKKVHFLWGRCIFYMVYTLLFNFRVFFFIYSSTNLYRTSKNLTNTSCSYHFETFTAFLIFFWIFFICFYFIYGFTFNFRVFFFIFMCADTLPTIRFVFLPYNRWYLFIWWTVWVIFIHFLLMIWLLQKFPKILEFCFQTWNFSTRWKWGGGRTNNFPVFLWLFLTPPATQNIKIHFWRGPPHNFLKIGSEIPCFRIFGTRKRVRGTRFRVPFSVWYF